MASAKQLSSQPFKDCDGIAVAGLFKRDKPSLQPCSSLIECNETKKQTIKQRCKGLQLWRVEWKMFFGTGMFHIWQHIDTLEQFGTTSSSSSRLWVSMGLRRDFEAVWQEDPNGAQRTSFWATSAQNSSHSHSSRTDSSLDHCFTSSLHNAAWYQINRCTRWSLY